MRWVNALRALLDTWLCDCGHLNPTQRVSCETCGRRREL